MRLNTDLTIGKFSISLHLEAWRSLFPFLEWGNTDAGRIYIRLDVLMFGLEVRVPGHVRRSAYGVLYDWHKQRGTLDAAFAMPGAYRFNPLSPKAWLAH